jgi:hypothetical protein
LGKRARIQIIAVADRAPSQPCGVGFVAGANAARSGWLLSLCAERLCRAHHTENIAPLPAPRRELPPDRLPPSFRRLCGCLPEALRPSLRPLSAAPHPRGSRGIHPLRRSAVRRGSLAVYQPLLPRRDLPSLLPGLLSVPLMLAKAHAPFRGILEPQALAAPAPPRADLHRAQDPAARLPLPSAPVRRREPPHRLSRAPLPRARCRSASAQRVRACLPELGRLLPVPPTLARRIP